MTRYASAAVVAIAVLGAAAGKAPDLPVDCPCEFRVLPAEAVEYFEAETAFPKTIVLADKSVAAAEPLAVTPREVKP